MLQKNVLIITFIVFVVFCLSADARAEFEIGARFGFDSNVNRSVDSKDSDFMMTAYGSYSRQPSGETRVDWTLRAVIEGTGYADYSDLNNAAATLSPGLSIFLNPQWSLNISPFVQGKAVSDSDQSALAYGVRATLKQNWNTAFYTGQYYLYSKSEANEDIYSTSENAVGVFVGVNWTPAFFTEIGYEYSRGDSYKTASTETMSASSTGGRGYRHRYSTTYNSYVYSEKVDRNSFSVNMGYNFTKSLFSLLGYTYTREDGDLDSLTYHTGFIGLGYRF
jgi:hypothetical protein